MILLDALAAKFESEGIGTIGVDIFVGTMPADITQGIRMWIRPGEVGDIPDVRRSDVQVVARALTFPDAYALADKVFESLTMDRHYFPGVVIYSSRPTTQPFPFGREEGSVWHMAVNAELVWIKDTANGH